MNLFGKLIAGLFALWAVAMAVGLIIALMPVILFIVGFVLMMAILAFVARLVGSWFGY